MLFDYVLAYTRVAASTVSGKAKAILVNLAGIGDGLEGTDGEASAQEPLFGQLGVVARPRASVSAKDATGLEPEGYTEVVSARTSDGLQPLAARDLRLNARVNLKEGEIAVAQYGGGFLSLSDASDGKGTQAVLFAPALKADGEIDKSHAIVLDPAEANRSIAIVHADGMSITMNKGGEIVLSNKDGTQWIALSDDAITISGTIKMVGGIMAGDPVTAGSVARADELQTWATAVNATLAAIKVAMGVTAGGAAAAAVKLEPGIPVTPPLSPTVASATLKASIT